MKFISTAQLEEKVLQEFFEEQWEQFDEKLSLQQYGYLVDYQDEYKAYFALSPVEEQSFWLKSLYIKEGVPATFPLTIIESSIALAKEEAGQYLYVFSHQQALHSLLELLQFQAEATPAFAKGVMEQEGTWWRLNVQAVHNKVKNLEN